MRARTRNAISVDEPRLRELWEKPLSIVEIAEKLRVMEWDVVRAARKLRLPNRRSIAPQHKPPQEPTQFEIEQRCLEVQQRWRAQDRELRAVGRTSKRWEPPLYRLQQRAR